MACLETKNNVVRALFQPKKNRLKPAFFFRVSMTFLLALEHVLQSSKPPLFASYISDILTRLLGHFLVELRS